MNRLQLELHRLYLTQAASSPDVPALDAHPIDADPAAAGLDDVMPRDVVLDTRPVDAAASSALIDAEGRVRALVLELARPADWAVLSVVWNAVQADLELPAPAIAVNGRDGYQLWFSLARPMPAARGLAWLEALRQRYLGDVKPRRLALLPAVDVPAADATSAQPSRHADLVPALQPGSGVWSAFVAQDLAPMFADEPWLDLPPNVDGQAKLLARLVSMQPADVERSFALLRSIAAPVPSASEPPAATDAAHMDAVLASVGSSGDRPASAGEPLDPRSFLQGVMSDERVPLALRIEAAKALLTCAAPSAQP
jgi:hypothetical protein